MSATYAESVGEKPFNWLEFLDARIEGNRGGASIKTAMSKASQWPTCACGNQCDIIPRYKDGGRMHSPIDYVLRSLGYDFYTAVLDQDWIAAKDTFLRIEARSAKLIAQLATPQRKPQKRRAG